MIHCIKAEDARLQLTPPPLERLLVPVKVHLRLIINKLNSSIQTSSDATLMRPKVRMENAMRVQIGVKNIKKKRFYESCLKSFF